jgi:hypothetical protein
MYSLYVLGITKDADKLRSCLARSPIEQLTDSYFFFARLPEPSGFNLPPESSASTSPFHVALCRSPKIANNTSPKNDFIGMRRFQKGCDQADASRKENDLPRFRFI